ncbi:MAG TPA: PatB family C-S lyase [Candidatus Krumholzibacteria bacterium]|nr:PatB family C-S lyase [Candidatus Krumholzibacteria bacterium]HPD72621.1 PatB family C-S lyase [Candidatus Krumholzibacteria bacterium]HRY40447.1 PatB family C-S lyase [Candidatus Krumholzibacteria bacterium]
MTDPAPGFNFDRDIDRRGTASVKWDRYGDPDILPLWVADTDFASPPAVLAALRERVDHGVFGYTLPPRELEAEVVRFLGRSLGWRVEGRWLVWLPGLVSGLAACCRAFAAPGEAVLTSTPIYPPFLRCPAAMERGLQTAPLALRDGRWRFDWDALEAAIDSRTRLFLFCSPHNPCGRIWERAELERLANLCGRHDLVICSDEIHNQLLLDQGPHVPTACLGPDVAARTVTLMAPSKTYNIPGLGCSFAIIPDDHLRRRFERAAAMIVPHVGALAYTAALAAYRHGDAWLAAQLAYLRRGRDLVEAAVAEIPGVAMAHVEATYLAWIDCRDLQVADLAGHFEKGGLGVQGGDEFGLPGFVRLNFGTTHARVVLALERFRQACSARG